MQMLPFTTLILHSNLSIALAILLSQSAYLSLPFPCCYRNSLVKTLHCIERLCCAKVDSHLVFSSVLSFRSVAAYMSSPCHVELTIAEKEEAVPVEVILRPYHAPIIFWLTSFRLYI